MKRIMSLVLVAAMSFSFVGCANKDTSNDNTATTEATAETSAEATADVAANVATDAIAGEAASGATIDLSGKRLAIVLKNTGNPYNERQADGFSEAVEALGGTAIVKAPDTPTVEAQISMVESLIQQKVDGIAIAGNDFDALQNVLTRAMEAGIPVISLDSAVNAESRKVHVNQADSQKIGEELAEAAYDLTGGSGEFAVLSATSQADNQNTWIRYMEAALKDSKYADLTLVKIAYGDDLRDKSTSETEALLQSYPNLKCIVAPTTVGIAAAAKVVQDKGLSDTIKVTGLGLPSEMAEYIQSGTTPYMFLWNPIDVGYLAGCTLGAIVAGQSTGAVGDSFEAGRLGSFTITEDPAGGTEVLLGAPFKFTPENIDEWKEIY